MMILPKELPKYECLQQMAEQVPEVDPTAVEACLHLLRTAADVSQAFDAHFQRHGISQGRFTVLMLLMRQHHEKGEQAPGMSPSELAESAGVTRATMTGLVDGLERDAFVVREPAPDDRRTLLIRLTPKATCFLTNMFPDHFRRVAALMAFLPQADRETLMDLLAKVRLGVPAVADAEPLDSPTPDPPAPQHSETRTPR